MPSGRGRSEVHLVIGGKAHDFDFVRRELLHLLAEDERRRTRVSSTWEEFDGDPATLLISYTCSLAPSDAAAARLRRFVRNGGYWIALHGTNSLLDWTDAGVCCAPAEGDFLDTLGSSFQAHPVIAPYRVDVAAPDHPIVADIAPFEVTDELYLSDFSADVDVLLTTRFGGAAPGFVRDQWDMDDRPVLYLRRLGKGVVIYCTLGHARGHYDAPHRTPFYPVIERGAWEVPAFRTVLQRCLHWAEQHLWDKVAA